MINKLKKELCLHNYSVIAQRDNFNYHSFSKGIKPILLPLREDKYFFKDCILVDKAIGKAVGMLLIRSKIKEVYALVMSTSAISLFEEYNIKYGYDQEVPYIKNNKGDDYCPMEKTIKDIDDLEEAYIALNKKLDSMIKI